MLHKSCFYTTAFPFKVGLVLYFDGGKHLLINDSKSEENRLGKIMSLILATVLTILVSWRQLHFCSCKNVQLTISRNATSLRDYIVNTARTSQSSFGCPCRRFNAYGRREHGCECGKDFTFDETTMSCVHTHIFRRREGRFCSLCQI